MSESSTPMRIAAGRWVRHAFVWDNLVSALKTFTWLGPLTLVIWVYAERAQVVQVDSVSFPIAVQSADPNRFVRLKNDPNVIATFSGPRTRIEALRQSIRPKGTEPAVVINLDPKLPLGDSPLDAIAQLSQAEQFRYSGVNIVQVQPQLLQVVIDSYADREVDVQKPSSVRNLVSEPQFSPAKIRVRAPSQYLAESGPITVEADLAASNALDRPGKWPTTVPVYSPQLLRYEGVTYFPGTVSSTLEVGTSTREYVFPSLPVKPVPPGGDFMDRYRIQAERWAVFGVRVVGPPDRIAQIEAGNVAVYAELPISAGDAPTDGNPTRTPRAVKIRDLPDGVTVATAPEEFEFTVVPRTAP